MCKKLIRKECNCKKYYSNDCLGNECGDCGAHLCDWCTSEADNQYGSDLYCYNCLGSYKEYNHYGF